MALNIIDYYKLTLAGFDSLKRDIIEAENFTVQQYNIEINKINEQAKKENLTNDSIEKKEKKDETDNKK